MTGNESKVKLLEQENNSCFSFILEDEALFSETEYKVLLNTKDDVFVRCVRMNYNGKPQLFYMREGLREITVIQEILNEEDFLEIIKNFLKSLMAVSDNGLLDNDDIVTSTDRIYFDPATKRVKLVYVPLEDTSKSSSNSFEEEIRKVLVSITERSILSVNERISAFLAEMIYNFSSLRELLKYIENENKKREALAEAEAVEALIPTRPMELKLVAVNSPVSYEIKVIKDEFLIGSRADTADGVVLNNKTISRRHCKIIKKDNSFLIMDSGSTNGTFVNDVALQPYQAFEIKEGDLLRLANSYFKVVTYQGA